MKTLCSALLALVSVIALAPAFAQSDQVPPTAVIIQDDFSPVNSQWQPAVGTWTVANGTYGNAARLPTSITTITSYRGVHPATPPESAVQFQDFTVSARMRNPGTTDDQLVGLVYGYQDSQNYYELVVSGTGRAVLRTVMNGIAVNEAARTLSLFPQGQWFDVQVRWHNGKTEASVNGLGFAQQAVQPEFTSGQIGFVAHGTLGKFDKMFLGVPFGDQEFFEMFDEAPFVTFAPQSGSWSVVNNTYVNSAVQQTNVTLAPIHTGPHPQDGDTMEYTFRANMLNPYGNTGNQVGIVFNYKTTEYTEVVFSSKGIIELNRVVNRVKHTIATASYSAVRNRPFHVGVENGPGHFAVILNFQQRFFENVDINDVNPDQIPEGGVGLITHWDPGRFDNVGFERGFFRPCSLTFSEQPPSPLTIVNGEWNTTGGTLNNASLDSTDIANFASCSGVSFTRGALTARLRNEYGASGNRVGLVYGYQSSGLRQGEYYEVTFSPTGVVQLNKFIQGTLYPIKTGSYPVPGKAFFTVELSRFGAGTTIKVNGTTVVDLVFQGDMGSGIGVVSHWTKGHFDDVKVVDTLGDAPSEL
ncbi:MAG TPA: hypothetical protein VJS12_23245 [Steroidobacteraceae bacterium]|nr:hypothetical protein [Steroidobacteraceae bacterium]